MKTRPSRRPRLAIVYLLIILAALPLVAQRTQPTTPAQVNRRPRLVLLIAVDQFRRDYLERFGDLFVNNGFRRLLRDGASWEEANYDHVPTYTACGHATMMTGAYPSETGIVGNEWIERETGRLFKRRSVGFSHGLPVDLTKNDIQRPDDRTDVGQHMPPAHLVGGLKE